MQTKTVGCPHLHAGVTPTLNLGDNAMEVTTVVTAMKDAVATVGKLREAAKKLQNAELKSIIAELASQLSDAQLKVAELKDEIVTLRAENQSLKEREAASKPSVKWGCYTFPNDENLYCPACYDTKGKKHLTTRLNSQRRQCTVCKATMGAG